MYTCSRMLVGIALVTDTPLALTYAHVCSRMLTYAGRHRACDGYAAGADVCSRMLTYAHVCSRMLTYADQHGGGGIGGTLRPHTLVA